MTGSGSDWAPSITTDWLLLLKKPLIQWMVVGNLGGGINTVAVEGGKEVYSDLQSTQHLSVFIRTRTIIDWNTLSPHSVNSPSIDSFRARITKNKMKLHDESRELLFYVIFTLVALKKLFHTFSHIF